MNNSVIFYTHMWNDEVPQEDVEKFCNWSKKTGARICWVFGYASENSCFPLIDRGYTLSNRDYEGFKALFDIPTDTRVGYNDFEAMFLAAGGEHRHDYAGNEFTEVILDD